jgi:hypothetical protein
MQKTKILQTLSVVGLTALCSIQNVEAGPPWTVELETVGTSTSLLHAFVQLSVVLSESDVVELAYYKSESELRSVSLQSLPLELEQKGNLSGNREVGVGVLNDRVMFTVGFTEDSGSVSDMKCFVKTAQGADSYTVSEEDVGKTWSEMLDKAWPKSRYGVMANFSTGTLQCSEVQPFGG